MPVGAGGGVRAVAPLRRPATGRSTGSAVYQPELPAPWVIWKPPPTQLCIGLLCAMLVARTLVNDTWLGACTWSAYVPGAVDP